METMIMLTGFCSCGTMVEQLIDYDCDNHGNISEEEEYY